VKTRDRDRALSRAVHDFAAECGRKRAVRTTVHVGSPAGESITIPHEKWYDGGMRADLLERALSVLALPEPLVWITRRGACRASDDDHAWCAATIIASARLGRATPFYVVTRRAWLEPATGAGRTWARIRTRPDA